jgi:hypothetical protein
VLKKVFYGIVAVSLVFAAQAASADDTQFEVGGGRYQGVSALPFPANPSHSMADRETVTPRAAPQSLERTHAGAVVMQSAPAPYNEPGGYFN